jgi:predicted RecB family nuclease
LNYDIKDPQYGSLVIASTVGAVVFNCNEIARAADSDGNPCYSTDEIAASMMYTVENLISPCSKYKGYECLATIGLARLKRKQQHAHLHQTLFNRLRFSESKVVESPNTIDELRRKKGTVWYTADWPIHVVDSGTFETVLQRIQSNISAVKKIAIDSEFSNHNIATLQLAFAGTNDVYILDMLALTAAQVEELLYPFWSNDKITFLGIHI